MEVAGIGARGTDRRGASERRIGAALRASVAEAWDRGYRIEACPAKRLVNRVAALTLDDLDRAMITRDTEDRSRQRSEEQEQERPRDMEDRAPRLRPTHTGDANSVARQWSQTLPRWGDLVGTTDDGAAERAFLNEAEDRLTYAASSSQDAIVIDLEIHGGVLRDRDEVMLGNRR